MPKIFIASIRQPLGEVCNTCSAICKNEKRGINLDRCKPAELESNIGGIPTYNQAKEAGIDMTNIPKYCPNGYQGLSSLPIRQERS